AEFDRRAGWAADGALSCVDWVVWRVGLARSTAKEKLRVAHEIRRRAAVRDAFAAGDVSYSKVRAITRVVDADATTDRRLLELAKVGTAADVERVVRHFEQLQQQERGVDDYLRRFDRRSLRAARTFDGMMVIEMVLPIEEGEELLRHVRVAEAVDKASAETLSTGPARPREAHSRLEHRATPGDHGARWRAMSVPELLPSHMRRPSRRPLRRWRHHGGGQRHPAVPSSPHAGTRGPVHDSRRRAGRAH